MFDMKKKAKTREYTKIASDVEQPPCRFVCQPPKSDLRDGRKRLIIAILFCLFFIICEITGEIVADFDFVYLIAIITIHSLDFSSYFRLFVWCTQCKIQLHLVCLELLDYYSYAFLFAIRLTCSKDQQKSIISADTFIDKMFYSIRVSNALSSLAIYHQEVYFQFVSTEEQ